MDLFIILLYYIYYFILVFLIISFLILYRRPLSANRFFFSFTSNHFSSVELNLLWPFVGKIIFTFEIQLFNQDKYKCWIHFNNFACYKTNTFDLQIQIFSSFLLCLTFISVFIFFSPLFICLLNLGERFNLFFYMTNSVFYRSNSILYWLWFN